MFMKFSVISLSMNAQKAVDCSTQMNEMSTFRQFKHGCNLIVAGAICAFNFHANAAPATHAQTEEWQREVKEQLKLKLDETMSGTNSKIYISKERMAELQNQAKTLATQDGAFNRHQIGRYCKYEISSFCRNKDLSDPTLGECLINNVENLGPQCKTVTADGFTGEPTKGDLYHHDVLIPARSKFFYLPNIRSIGVRLSRPTTFDRLQIKTEITWYEGGSIRSFIPADNPVKYGSLTFAPSQTLVFFPNGQVKKGVLYESINIDSLHLPAGTEIQRADHHSTWSIKH